MFIEANQLLNIDLINENLFNTSNNIKAREIYKEILSTKQCIFDPFIKLFHRSNRCSYTPSYFIPTKLEAKVYDFNLLEYIMYNQYIILQYSTDHMIEMKNIVVQYQSIINRLLEN
jgi:hypothetical protein